MTVTSADAIPKVYSRDLQSVIDLCLEQMPRRRPDINQVLGFAPIKARLEVNTLSARVRVRVTIMPLPAFMAAENEDLALSFNLAVLGAPLADLLMSCFVYDTLIVMNAAMCTWRYYDHRYPHRAILLFLY